LPSCPAFRRSIRVPQRLTASLFFVRHSEAWSLLSESVLCPVVRHSDARSLSLRVCSLSSCPALRRSIRVPQRLTASLFFVRHSEAWSLLSESVLCQVVRHSDAWSLSLSESVLCPALRIQYVRRMFFVRHSEAWTVFVPQRVCSLPSCPAFQRSILVPQAQRVFFVRHSESVRCPALRGLVFVRHSVFVLHTQLVRQSLRDALGDLEET